MNLAALVVFCYGLFSVVGGLIGFVKAQSKASLIAGSISGGVMLVCSYGIANGNLIAAGMSLAVALLLGLRFLGTWLKNHRVMPDLLMVLFSVATVISVAIYFLQK